MSAPVPTGREIEYLKGYRVLRDDPEWLSKIGVGSVLLLSTMCIPLVGQLTLLGHQALILRRAVTGIDSPMPKLELSFDYIGKLFGTGFKAFIVRFLWSLPITALAFGMVACVYVGAAAAVVGARESGAGMAVGTLVCAGIGAILGFVVLVAVSIPVGVASMRAELTDKLEAGLAFGEVIAFTKRQFRPLLAGTLILSLVAVLLSVVGLLACYVGVFPVAILNLVAHTHFMAQVYQRDVEQGGPALPIGPTEV